MTIDYDKPILNKKGNPLKIGMLATHMCIRVQKRARALRKIGYEIHGLGHRTTYGTDEYETYSVWANKKQFQNSVKTLILMGCDILDYSNEPDFPVLWAREVIDAMNKQDSVKLITDLHDLDSIRLKSEVIPKNEREMFNASDGLIYVSLPIQKITNKLHTVSVPNICLYSYCNKGIIEYDENIERANTLVYEGGVNPLDATKMNETFPYRNLYPIFQQLVVQGNEVHALLGNSDAYISGQHTGVNVCPPKPYDEMMKMLVQHKWGILAFNNQHNTEPQVKYTLTNKMQEYLQAGLPSLALWCGESEIYVKKHDIGIVFERIEDIGDCSHLEDDYNRIIENIKIKREQLVMENFIWKVENLYSEVLGVQKKHIPDNIKDLDIFEYNTLG